ncbi:MAG: phenylalanine--tRNA ligase subunit beta [Verrucomicrobia bacterium]|nr:phenylalanine--tRNA ligase subunit beta [Verrucomicrobiota bacterium]
MKLPLSLLKPFIHQDLPLAQIAETLTLLGIEVDAIENERPPFANVVVGEILSANRHPNAEKLQIAEVTDGSKTYQIVCGASNCRAGLKTAFARVGAVLTDAKGNPMTIEAAKLRGVDSAGMLCSEQELKISDSGEGIMELPSDWKNGSDLVPLLWDPVFELSLTPNLGYCLSAKGIARELSASLNLPFHVPSKLAHETKKQNRVSVSVRDPKLCPRYMGRFLENLKIGPSPFWLQKVLKAAGMRPINNAVDITNYILLKWGQPMHAFDADLLEGSIHVSVSDKAMNFACLDGTEREVPVGTLLISDSHKPVALAGVMGGANTSVSENTKNIFLEAAYFDPMVVRIASKKMGLRSESSFRFEKGVDPLGIPEALNEACALFIELCGAQLLEGTVNIKGEPFAPKEIRCRARRTREIIGHKFSLNEIEEIFHRLGFHTKALEQETLLVQVPFYRFDVNEEIDLIEEVARIYGYNKIEKGTPLCTISQIPHDPLFLFERKLRSALIDLGLQELITCDLISPKLAELEIESKTAPLKVLHSKSEEYSILRSSFLPGFLQVAQYNIDQKNPTIAGFEIGRVHLLQEGKPAEFPTAALVLSGKIGPAHWDRKSNDADFYDLKGILENLFDAIHIESSTFKPSKHPSFHPNRQASIYVGDLSIGSFGEVHPLLLEKIDIKQRVFFAELSLAPLLSLQNKTVIMKPLPQFPSSERDWTIPLPKEFLMQTIFDAIAAARSMLLEKAELIDLFHAETKNATFRFTYRDLYKTISFEEVEKEHAHIMQEVTKHLPK